MILICSKNHVQQPSTPQKQLILSKVVVKCSQKWISKVIMLLNIYIGAEPYYIQYKASNYA